MSTSLLHQKNPRNRLHTSACLYVAAFSHNRCVKNAYLTQVNTNWWCCVSDASLRQTGSCQRTLTVYLNAGAGRSRCQQLITLGPGRSTASAQAPPPPHLQLICLLARRGGGGAEDEVVRHWMYVNNIGIFEILAFWAFQKCPICAPSTSRNLTIFNTDKVALFGHFWNLQRARISKIYISLLFDHILTASSSDSPPRTARVAEHQLNSLLTRTPLLRAAEPLSC